MNSRSISVMYITFGDFTLLNEFCLLIEALATIKKQQQVACNVPYPAKLYTKAALKANPMRSLTVTGKGR